MTTVTFVQTLLDWLLADPSHIVAAASALAAAIPTPAPGTWQAKLFQVVDLLAVNILHAKEGGAQVQVGPVGQTTAPPPPRAAGPVVALMLMLGAVVSACAGKMPADTLYEIRAVYDAGVLTPMAGYARLPVCDAANQVRPCRDDAVLAELRKADASASAALDAAEDVVRHHPDMDASAAIAAAQDAVDVVKTIMVTYGIGQGGVK